MQFPFQDTAHAVKNEVGEMSFFCQGPWLFSIGAELGKPQGAQPNFSFTYICMSLRTIHAILHPHATSECRHDVRV